MFYLSTKNVKLQAVVHNTDLEGYYEVVKMHYGNVTGIQKITHYIYILIVIRQRYKVQFAYLYDRKYVPAIILC